jgi:hypothetical protein
MQRGEVIRARDTCDAKADRAGAEPGSCCQTEHTIRDLGAPGLSAVISDGESLEGAAAIHPKDACAGDRARIDGILSAVIADCQHVCTE